MESRRVKKGDCRRPHSIQNAGQYCGNLLRAKGQHNVNYTGTFCAGAPLGRQVGLNAESIDGGQQKMSSPFELTDPQIEETDRTEFLCLPFFPFGMKLRFQ